MAAGNAAAQNVESADDGPTLRFTANGWLLGRSSFSKSRGPLPLRSPHRKPCRLNARWIPRPEHGWDRTSSERTFLVGAACVRQQSVPLSAPHTALCSRSSSRLRRGHEASSRTHATSTLAATLCPESTDVRQTAPLRKGSLLLRLSSRYPRSSSFAVELQHTCPLRARHTRCRRKGPTEAEGDPG